MRRQSGASKPARTASLRYGLLGLFLLPWALAKSNAQQPSSWRPDAASNDAVSSNLYAPIASAPVKRAVDAVYDRNTVSAGSALAPANWQQQQQRQNAVRAPSFKSSSESRLSQHTSARALQDWEVEDIVLLATVDGTIHARDRKTGVARWALHSETPMVETIDPRPPRGSSKRPEDNLLWIIEPNSDGSIYLYHSEPQPGVQRLGLTIKELVEGLSPYRSVDPPVIYNAEKKSSLYFVDARSGKVLKTFSSGGSLVPDSSICKPVSRVDGLEDEECGSNGTITLGKTEYTLKIQHPDAGDLYTIKYWEWVPNNRDIDLQLQYKSTMDQKYIYSGYDGHILAMEHIQAKEPRKLYTHKLSSPVVRVFDVARPLDKVDSDSELIILPQPVEKMLAVANPEFQNRVFVDCTEQGGWFAMSELNYPLVTNRVEEANCYKSTWSLDNPDWSSLDTTKKRHAIAGMHSLNRQMKVDFPSLPAISNSEENGDAEPNQTELHPEIPESYPQPVIPAVPSLVNSRLLGFAAANFIDMILLVPLITLFIFLYVNKQKLGKVLAKKLDVEKMPVLKEVFMSPPQSPLPPELLRVENPPLTVPQVAGRSDDLSTDVDDTPKKKVGFADSVGDDDGLTQDEQAPAKRKRPRGRRGGQRIQQRKAQGETKKTDDTKEAKDDALVDEIIKEAGELPVNEPNPLSVAHGQMIQGDVAVAPGEVQIGSLVVSDNVLGHGSHGTIVYKGRFEGKDVAVKRMLQAYYHVASHEVNLLQESDDHPNVIRYYCKQQNSTFLYIALELCEASLADVVEKPLQYEHLHQYIDRANMLYQITNGVRHLHSLKIVHRDLKPHNILVTAPKVPRGDKSLTLPPRMLISDFGLCKKLEGDQSSFRATTAHAAGTVGWRASELLLDEDSNTNGNSLGDTTHSSNHSDAIIDPAVSRRATRAIDIFALGCVFYYVLTQGGHPFGDRNREFERENNIVHGRYNLDSLLALGEYSQEAIDLISRMIDKDPKKRPEATAVIIHPFFWSAEKRLNFLTEVSDCFEPECRDPPSQNLLALESGSREVIGGDFLRRLDKSFVETLGKQRKYTGSSMLDLLRALRNKKNHYQDMPQHVKDRVGELPGGYLNYWTTRFPRLLLHSYYTILECGFDREPNFKPYFTAPGRDG